MHTVYGMPTRCVCHRLLVGLKESNRAAFLALLQQDLEGMLPLVYTPVIAEACLRWGTLLPRPLGLYVGPGDDPAALVMNWPSQEVCVLGPAAGYEPVAVCEATHKGCGVCTISARCSVLPR